MKFKIKEQVMPKYKDSFVVKIKVMHGDMLMDILS